MGGSGIDFLCPLTDRWWWSGRGRRFFGVGATIFGLGWGVFFSFSLLFFWDEECVGVGGEEVFWALACVTHLSSSERKEEEEKGTTDVASSDGAGLTNPPSQKQFE